MTNTYEIAIKNAYEILCDEWQKANIDLKEIYKELSLDQAEMSGYLSGLAFSIIMIENQARELGIAGELRNIKNNIYEVYNG